MIDAKTVRNRVFAQPTETEKRIDRYKAAKDALESREAMLPGVVENSALKLIVDSQVARAREEFDFATKALKEWLCTLPRQQYRDGLTVYHVDRTGQMHVQKTGRSA